MYIILFVLLIVPGIVAAHIYLKDDKEMNYFDIIYQVAKFTYMIMFTNFMAMLLRGWGEFAFERISVIFVVKYLMLSSILVIGLPLINKIWVEYKNNIQR